MVNSNSLWRYQFPHSSKRIEEIISHGEYNQNDKNFLNLSLIPRYMTWVREQKTVNQNGTKV